MPWNTLLILDQVADLVVNAGLGFGVGVVASVLLFRRKPMPLGLDVSGV